MEDMNVPDTAIENFLADLKTINNTNNFSVAVPRDNIATPENIEEFVLKNTSEVINSAVNMMKSVEQNVQAIQGPEEIAAYSELVNASTNAIETLSKILIQKKKSETLVNIKKMDVENKKELQSNDHQMKVMASREEILKMMLSNKQKEKEAIIVEEIKH
jgi:hypothetical protein